MQTIIRKDHTLDRPEFRITTQEVFEIAQNINQPFTTGDIAAVIVGSGNYRGIGYNRIERGVRAGVSWLVHREIAYEDGNKIYRTKAGVISKPYLYSLYPGRTWNDEIKRMEIGYGSIDLLDRVFVLR